MKLNTDFCLWMSAIGFCVVLEIFGLVTNKDYTLTSIIRAYIPLWLRASILGFLSYHFLIAKSK